MAQESKQPPKASEPAGKVQTGNKADTVGQPVPGIAVKIVDPDTMEELPTGQPGLLLIKGPNIMAGYLNMEEQTRQVFSFV